MQPTEALLETIRAMDGALATFRQVPDQALEELSTPVRTILAEQLSNQLARVERSGPRI